MCSTSRGAEAPRVQNRLRAVMLHIPWYTVDGQARLVADTGISLSTINRLVCQRTDPYFSVAKKVTDVLAKRLGVPLDIREVFTDDGTYPTGCVCDLSPSCFGCYPPGAFREDDTMKPEYQDLRPGDWCRYPESTKPIPSRSKPVNFLR